MTADHRSLDIYLSEMNTGYLNTDSEKLFDHLDFVFIDGDENILPWYEKGRKFLILIRMCKKTRKLLFASGFAMQMMVFLCATNLHISRIVNGGGKGSSVEEFKKTDQSVLQTLGFGDTFLDSSTGDMYGYDTIKGEFYPIANVGLHNHKTAQESGISHIEKARSAMLKPFKYQSTSVPLDDKVFISKTSESKFRIAKLYSTHWLNSGLGLGEHLVLCGNAWDVHPTNTSDPENYYKILAESERGPMITCLNNAVCTQFHIHPKYPSSIKVLVNFVVHYMGLIHAQRDRIDIPMSQAQQLPASHVLMKGSGAGEHNPGQAGQHSVAYAIAAHSGFAFSRRTGPLLVGNNATTNMTIKAERNAKVVGDNSTESSGYSFTTKYRPKKSKPHTVLPSPKRNSIVAGRRSALMLTTAAQAEASAKNMETWSARDVRVFLHPGYPVEGMPKVMNLMDSITKDQFSKSPEPEKPSIKVVYETYRPHFRNASLEEIRRPIGLETPYQELERQMMLSQKSDKRKWVSPKDFRRVFPQTSKVDLKADYSAPKGLNPTHQYRLVAKEKWLSGPWSPTSSKS